MRKLALRELEQETWVYKKNRGKINVAGEGLIERKHLKERCGLNEGTVEGESERNMNK